MKPFTLLASLLVIAVPLVAQEDAPDGPVTPAPCNNEWYVDPVNGLDTNPGTIALPFQTLTFTMTVATASAGSDTIMLFPGIYELLETFPILMAPDTSIQGTNALNTVLIARNPAASALRFDPTGTTATAYDNSCVDGITIVGARRCVEIWDGVVSGQRVRSNPTLANCFLIDSAVAAIDILVSDASPTLPAHDVDSNGFVENRPKFINLTIITSIIGILNQHVSPTQGFASWGESEPGLLNVLLSDNPSSDLEGIDAGDVFSCAFRLADNAGISPIKAGVLPVPVFNTSTNPPLYVEPSLGAAVTPFDLRVQPGSPAIDAGTMPALAWPNGTVGQATFPCTIDIFDADCEGYGNLRTERVAIDIGADENGELIIAGYQRGTTDLNLGFNSPFPGFMAVWLNPWTPFPPGTYDGFFFVNTFGGPNFWVDWAPVTIQGLRANLTVPATATAIGTQWMNTAVPLITFTQTFAAPGTPLMLPITPSVLTQLNWQVLPIQGALSRPLSNLQTNFNTL